MTTYLGSKTAAGQIRDVHDGNGYPVKQTGVTPTERTFTIANGASLSGAIEIGGEAVVGIIMPSAWTTANLTFQASADGGSTYLNLYDAIGSEVTVNAAADRYIRLSPADWVGMTHIKVRSGTSGTPVNQGAARSIKLVTRAV